MKKKAVLILFLIGVFIISLLPAVEAARDEDAFGNAFGFISDILNTPVKLPHVGPVLSKLRATGKTAPLGVVGGAFVMIYSLMFVVVGRIPLFQGEGTRNARIAFAVGFTIVTILVSPIIETIADMVGTLGSFGAVALFVIGIVAIAGLFALTGKAFKWGRGEAREEAVERAEERREEAALKQLIKLNKKGLSFDAAVVNRLKQIISYLEKLMRYRVGGSEKIRSIMQQILDQLNAILRAIKIDLSNVTKRSQSVLKKFEKWSIKEFRDDKTLAKISAKLKTKKMMKDYNYKQEHISNIARSIYGLNTKKLQLCSELSKIENNLVKEEENFLNVMKKAIDLLKVDNIPEAISELRAALNIAEIEERTNMSIGEIEQELVQLVKMDLGKVVAQINMMR